MKQTKKIISIFLRIIFGVMDIITHNLFRFMYRHSGEKAPPIKDLLLLDSATKIAFKIRTRKLKCIDVLESFIARIEQINPSLNCVVDNRFEEARKEAKNIDKSIEAGILPEDVLAREKPFLGVPFTTKISISVKGLHFTAGIYARKDIIAVEDAPTISLLKNAGAIPIALTNVSEACFWWESANTINGRTNNPYDNGRIVGGSSGGEGAIQAAAGSAFGIGSDIGGSIRMPAFFNGIFGHKPSPLIVSNEGQHPKIVSNEHNELLGVGPMCRHSEDLAPILKVLAGKNAPKLRLDEPVDVKSIDVFYQEDDQGAILVSPVNKEIKALFGRIATYFNKAHGKKMKKLEIKGFSNNMSLWFAAMKSQNAPTFAQQITNLNGSVNAPIELLKWCLRCSNHTFIALMTCFLEKIGMTYGSPKHIHLLDERDKLRKELLEILGDKGVFVYPTHPTAAPYHNEPIFKSFNFSYTSIINALKLPVTHVPMGLNSEGLPIGLQVASAPNNDRLCLAMAKELEKVFGGWVPPQLE